MARISERERQCNQWKRSGRFEEMDIRIKLCLWAEVLFVPGDLAMWRRDQTQLEGANWYLCSTFSISAQASEEKKLYR